MSFVFELWKTEYELRQVHFINEEAGTNRVCMPKVEATTFKGDAFGCTGEILLFQRNNQGAEFRMILNSGTGGVRETQPSGRVLVIAQPPPYAFKLPSTRRWKISSKKLRGKETLAREFTIEFDGPGGGQQSDIQNITITIPITMESDQAHVFSFGLDWAAAVVAANIAFGEFYAALHAGIPITGDGGL
jgi:hypothetical protein